MISIEGDKELSIIIDAGLHITLLQKLLSKDGSFLSLVLHGVLYYPKNNICGTMGTSFSKHLTGAEKSAGCTYVWKPMDEALEIFGKYEDYHESDIAVYGLYKREYMALKEYVKTFG